MRRFQVLVLLLLAWSVLATERVTPAPRVSPEVQFIAAGVQDARERLSCFSASVKYREVTSKSIRNIVVAAQAQQPASTKIESVVKDVEESSQVEILFQRPKLRMVVEPSAGSQGNLRRTELVSDGKVAKVLETYSKGTPNLRQVKDVPGAYYSALIAPAEKQVVGELSFNFGNLDPRAYGYYSTIVPLDEVLRDPDANIAFKGEVVLHGSRCMQVDVVEKESLDSFWFDVEHGFILRQSQSYELMGNTMVLTHQVRVPDLISSNGSYLPARVEDTAWWRVEFDPKAKTNKPNTPGLNDDDIQFDGNIATLGTITKSVVVSNFNTDCKFDRQTFVLSFPKGAPVQDEIANKEYVVGQSVKATPTRLVSPTKKPKSNAPKSGVKAP